MPLRRQTTTPNLSTLAMKRRQAAQLLAAGGTIDSVARAVALTAVTIRRYKVALEAAGVEGLRSIGEGGRKSALDDQAHAWIVDTVRASPRRHGFESDQWSTPALRSAIERQFGHRFSNVYVRQLTINLGVHDRMRSFKTPMRRSPGVIDTAALTWIEAALRGSPRLHDFNSDVWTNERLKTIIERKYGVRYSRNRIWRIGKDLGLSHLLSRSRK